MSTYSPTPVALGDITLPADGETVEASDVNVPLSAIADGVRISTPRVDRITTDGATWTVPSGVTSVRVRMQGPGGGGGGGSRGNSTNTADSFTTGGAGGGAGEYRDVVLTVTPGDVLTWAKGTAGTAGTGSGVGDGTSGGNASNSTLTSTASGVVLTARGGLGGGGGIRNIDTSETGASVGGRSQDWPSGTSSQVVSATSTASDAAVLDTLEPIYRWLGVGSGSGMYSAHNGTGRVTARLLFPGRTGVFATDGANGADDAGRIGGMGGGSGGSTNVAGGAGGAGGAAVSGGSGVAGSSGSAPAADSGAGGGGGGSGGAGTSGGAGANGAAGATGFLEVIYSGPQAVIT